MKISRSWLNHVTKWPIMTDDLAKNWHGVQFSESDEIIAETLTKLGLEVESVEKSGDLGAVDDSVDALAEFTVGEIIKAEKHPSADRLQVCHVATNTGTMQVVCGAPNARAGIKIAFAPVGSVIPHNGLKLKKSNIRGVESMGMCCSAWELNLSEDHEGIIEFPPDAKIGELVSNLIHPKPSGADTNASPVSDTVFDLSITPNRADCLGMQGIRRELVAAGLGQVAPRPNAEKSATNSSPKPVTKLPHITISIAEDTLPFCPHFAAQILGGVTNGSSPDWLVDLLNNVGHKSISTLVDVTNYMMLEANRPLHVFDADKIKGNLHIRQAVAGEKLLALNGKTYDLPAGAIVIADDSGVISLGGIMGGESTAVSLTTKNILIEAAWFDPARTAATGRALAIISDARHRFERGIDTDSSVPALAAAVAMVQNLCGGVVGVKSEAGKPAICRKSLSFRPSRVAGLGGVDVPPSQQLEIFAKLGFAVDDRSNPWQIMPPPWRLECEGEADLVEEILRQHGLDAMAAVPLPRPSHIDNILLSGAELNRIKTRRLLATRGLFEAVTWSFMDKDTAKLFGGGGDDLTLANPIAADLVQMRPTPLPNLLLASSRQLAHGDSQIGLFEIGAAFRNPTPKGQHNIAAGLRIGARQALWRQEGATMPHITGGRGHYDVFDAKSDVLAVLELLGFAAHSVQIANDAGANGANGANWYHPGQSGLVKLGDKMILAQFGMIHPKLLAHFDIGVPVAGFEIFLDAIPPAKNKGKSTAKPLLTQSAMQKLRRDFAFIVDEKIAAESLLKTARSVDKALIDHVDIFDVFQSDKLPAGKKSLALRVTLAPADRALTESEISDIEQKIIAAIAKDTGAVLRG